MVTPPVLLSAVTALIAQGAAASADSDADLGVWKINVTIGGSATGYRWQDIHAAYSGRPEQILHTGWKANPGQDIPETPIIPEDPTFRATCGYGPGDQPVTIQQTVNVAGQEMSLSGTGKITFRCHGLRSCTGSTVVIAKTT